MESPPSFSTLSEAPPLSEDSGLLITSGSFSSDSASGWHHVASELQESDFDERSLSPCESSETSERICGEFFNTVKKGPVKVLTTIEPPPEFQDNPVHVNLESFSVDCTPPVIICNVELSDAKLKPSLDIPMSSGNLSPRKLKPESIYERRQCLNHRFASPRLLHLSPCRGTRPSSRTSFTSRLSSSHNSLVTQFQADDSSFITQAISHDTLSAKTSDITDMYNVPFDSDIYAVPIDVVRPGRSNMKIKGKKPPKANKNRGKNTPQDISGSQMPLGVNKNKDKKDSKTKRHSLPGSSSKKNNVNDSDSEPQHLTLREMRRYLHTLYSSSSESEFPPPRDMVTQRSNNVIGVTIHARHQHIIDSNQSSPIHPSATASTAVFLTESQEPHSSETNNNQKKTRFGLKSKKHKDVKEISDLDKNGKSVKKTNDRTKISAVRMLSINLKQSFCNLFRWRRQPEGPDEERVRGSKESPPPAVRRALPPLPSTPRAARNARRSATDDDNITDFATSISKVKDYGWYWGPISVEAAEKILSNEPDGSFIVRDSSDDHYIFTLTFKLNGLRHVRIEHDQGNFCFGGCAMFKAATIVEFIENAVETSRSGRYLFFLNLRPVLGPMRVQLLYPVSRFKRVQSLQHMCRFVILKYVRRDLVTSLPLPRRLLDYLSATHYYSELLSDM